MITIRNNTTILVTGSVRGIGKVIASRLISDGFSVIVHGPDEAEARIIAQEIGAAGFVAGDLADAETPTRLITEIIAQTGSLYGIVNNAASTARSNLETTDAAFFDRMMAINLRAPLLLIQAALPHFRAQGGGKVVNIGSSNAYTGERNLLAYSLSKGGLMTLTRNLADAHGAEGIRVNQLNIGWTLSDSEYALKISEGLPEDWPSKLPRSVAPSGTINQPEDVAAMVAFLLSDDAPRVNGGVWDFDQYPLIGRNPPKETHE
jgi:NAD(P)-dependent dehydrogenase (short-subunit alcohol dehydrogenase family)